MYASRVVLCIETYARFQPQVICGFVDGVEEGRWLSATGAYRHLNQQHTVPPTASCRTSGSGLGPMRDTVLRGDMYVSRVIPEPGEIHCQRQRDVRHESANSHLELA